MTTAMTTATQPAPDDQQAERQTELRRLIHAQGSVLVALSGGIDSSVIAALASAELGEKAVAATGISASVPGHDLTAAQALCDQLGMEHVSVTTEELSIAGYTENSLDRCYYCKSELYERLATVADARGLARILDGTTAEELSGHRPGHRAAGEQDVLSPLVEVGATKADVRELARSLGVPDAERPSSPCLSSRIAYGVEVTSERLTRIARSETYLRSLGFRDVRVRLHGPIARVEVPTDQLDLMIERAMEITRELRAVGFTYVTVDLAGLRSGSLLEVLPDDAVL